MEASEKKITFVCWLIRLFTNFYPLGILVTLGMTYLVYGSNTNEAPNGSNFTMVLNILSGTIALISLLISIWAGLFTYKHFDEVWSIRMRWTNSRVDKIEARFSYSFKIAYRMFFMLFSAILILFFGISLGIAYLIGDK